MTEEAKFSLTDSLRSLEDANLQLQILNQDIARAGGFVTSEQRQDREQLRKQLSECADGIPRLVGNKSIIIP